MEPGCCQQLDVNLTGQPAIYLTGYLRQPDIYLCGQMGIYCAVLLLTMSPLLWNLNSYSICLTVKNFAHLTALAVGSSLTRYYLAVGSRRFPLIVGSRGNFFISMTVGTWMLQTWISIPFGYLDIQLTVCSWLSTRQRVAEFLSTVDSYIFT